MMLAGCTREVVSSAQKDLPERGWAMTDTAMLTLQVKDTAQAYDLALILRHTDNYAYQNLWLFLEYADSLSPVSGKDTIQAILADDHGRWLGTRAGRYYDGFVFVRRDLHFCAPGTYTYHLVHGMRDSVICGIADVGLELRVKSNK